jgi:CAAX prenyl protease-like protein
VSSATPTPTPKASALDNPAVAYVAPFLVFVLFLGLQRSFHLDVAVAHAVRFVLVTAVLLLVSRKVVTLRASSWGGSLLCGVAVFVVWIAPDLLWPGYRSHWLFQNSITGEVASSVPAALKGSLWFIVLRTASCALLVPVLEELFWRGWMTRWLVKPDFLLVPLGTFTLSSFLIVTVLFASEHGPFWDVGLAAGAIYNWWLWRTRNVADCIVAHAVTNACLSAYVLASGRWEYWL